MKFSPILLGFQKESKVSVFCPKTRRLGGHHDGLSRQNNPIFQNTNLIQNLRKYDHNATLFVSKKNCVFVLFYVVFSNVKFRHLCDTQTFFTISQIWVVCFHDQTFSLVYSSQNNIYFQLFVSFYDNEASQQSRFPVPDQKTFGKPIVMSIHQCILGTSERKKLNHQFRRQGLRKDAKSDRNWSI